MRCQDCDASSAIPGLRYCCECLEDRAEDLRDARCELRRLTRQEKLEYWADQGYDTWDEYLDYQ